MSVLDFVQGLPSYNEENFTQFASTKNISSAGFKKSLKYISTEDELQASKQIIQEDITDVTKKWDQLSDKKRKRQYDPEDARPEPIPSARKQSRYSSQFIQSSQAASPYSPTTPTSPYSPTSIGSPTSSASPASPTSSYNPTSPNSQTSIASLTSSTSPTSPASPTSSYCPSSPGSPAV